VVGGAVFSLELSLLLVECSVTVVIILAAAVSVVIGADLSFDGGGVTLVECLNNVVAGAVFSFVSGGGDGDFCKLNFFFSSGFSSWGSINWGDGNNC